MVRFFEQTVTRSSFGDRFVMPSMAELRTRVLAGAVAALGTVASVVVVVAGKQLLQRSPSRFTGGMTSIV